MNTEELFNYTVTKYNDVIFKSLNGYDNQIHGNMSMSDADYMQEAYLKILTDIQNNKLSLPSTFSNLIKLGANISTDEEEDCRVWAMLSHIIQTVSDIKKADKKGGKIDGYRMDWIKSPMDEFSESEESVQKDELLQKLDDYATEAEKQYLIDAMSEESYADFAEEQGVSRMAVSQQVKRYSQNIQNRMSNGQPLTDEEQKKFRKRPKRRRVDQSKHARPMTANRRVLMKVADRKNVYKLN